MGRAFFVAGGAAVPPSPDVDAVVREQLGVTLRAVFAGDEPRVTDGVRRLAEPPPSAPRASWPRWRQVVARELERYVISGVTEAWRRGWEPADVLRVVRRQLGADHVELARGAIGAEVAGYAAATVAPRWRAQLADWEATVSWPRDRTWLTADETRPWATTIRLCLELGALLPRLPGLQRLGPIPGEASHAVSVERPDVDERILERVRALLAKAESTNYPAEAETFTAGAQALMARHRIDRAQLDAGRTLRAEGPGARRIGIDNPYEAPKASLLEAVAAANQCRSAWSKGLGFSTVVGHETDLDVVELLFTSLLVQATAAMTHQGSRQYSDGASRTRSFRQSFLLAFAQRIGERLRTTTEEATRQAVEESGRSDLLPVLAARGAAVETVMQQLFPTLARRSVGAARDAEGWTRGRAAADLADLAKGSALGPPG